MSKHAGKFEYIKPKFVYVGPVSDRLLDHRPSTIDHRRSNLLQARTKFNRLLAMVDDLISDQKQALRRLISDGNRNPNEISYYIKQVFR